MDKHDETWKKDTTAKIMRVFRTTKVPFEQEKRIIVTVNLPERMENGTSMRRLFLSKKPNHAGQYVLEDNEQEYDRQLGALRRAEKNGKVLEVDPTWRGKPYVPPPPPDPRDERIKELEAKLAESKPASKRGESS